MGQIVASGAKRAQHGNKMDIVGLGEINLEQVGIDGEGAVAVKLLQRGLDALGDKTNAGPLRRVDLLNPKRKRVGHMK